MYNEQLINISFNLFYSALISNNVDLLAFKNDILMKSLI